MSDWRRFSRLPESPDYWDDLTGRVQQSLQDVEVEPARVLSLAPFAWTAIAAALVAFIASAYLPAAAATERSFETAIAPADSTGAAWLANAAPPSVMEMLTAVIR